MKLLLDQGLPRGLAPLLQERGFDTVHVTTVNLGDRSDDEILDYARANEQIVITIDADFHTMLALTQAAGPSVVRIRIEGLKAPALCSLLEDSLKQCLPDLEAGAMATVQVDRIRVRRLPLVREPEDH
ncbi:MAG: DUF5615 family PIN-like protein [Gemmataceae bacterium]